MNIFHKVAAWSVALVLAVVMGIAMAPTAGAEIYGTNVKWATTNIPVKVHAHEVGAKRIKTGIGYWQVTNLNLSTGGGTCLTATGVADGCIDIGDGAHFSDPSWVGAAERFSLADGTIVGCWVKFSADYNWGAGSSLRALADDVAAHEVGHCVGHAHTLDLTIPSEMQPTARNWNGLQPFDISEDLKLYPSPVSALTTSIQGKKIYKTTFVFKKNGSELVLTH